MVHYICNRCEKLIKHLDSNTLCFHPDYGEQIFIAGVGKAHLCHDCIELLLKINRAFLNSPEEYSSILVEIEKNNILLDESDDDHTSTWGGAGPDCSIVRREAAIC